MLAAGTIHRFGTPEQIAKYFDPLIDGELLGVGVDVDGIEDLAVRGVDDDAGTAVLGDRPQSHRLALHRLAALGLRPEQNRWLLIQPGHGAAEGDGRRQRDRHDARRSRRSQPGEQCRAIFAGCRGVERQDPGQVRRLEPPHGRGVRSFRQAADREVNLLFEDLEPLPLEGLEQKWSEQWKADDTYRFDRTQPRENVYSIDTPPPTASGACGRRPTSWPSWPTNWNGAASKR